MKKNDKILGAEELLIYQNAASAIPAAVRGGVWKDHGPEMGYTPMLAGMWVSCPVSKRGVFGSEEAALRAAADFQDKCKKKLIDMDEALPEGFVYVHIDVGSNEHIASSKCWCNPRIVGPDDDITSDELEIN